MTKRLNVYSICRTITVSISDLLRKVAAIVLALRNFINGGYYHSNKSILIHTDSKSALHCLHNRNPKENTDLIHKIFILIKKIHGKGGQVIFNWIPSHCGLLQNDIVDQLAKQASKSSGNFFTINPSKSAYKQNNLDLVKLVWNNRLFRTNAFSTH